MNLQHAIVELWDRVERLRTTQGVLLVLVLLGAILTGAAGVSTANKIEQLDSRISKLELKNP